MITVFPKCYIFYIVRQKLLRPLKTTKQLTRGTPPQVKNHWSSTVVFNCLVMAQWQALRCFQWATEHKSEFFKGSLFFGMKIEKVQKNFK